MGILRKIALGLLLAASASVLAIAGWELWGQRQSPAFPPSDRGLTTRDRARLLENRIDLLTKRVGDMEILVLILLGTSGLYALVFVASSYFTATGFGRQADQTTRHFQDQIGVAMGDLRQLQEDTEQRLRKMAAAAAEKALAPAIAAQAGKEPGPAVPPSGWDIQIAEITGRLTAWQDRALDEHSRLELMQDESTAACLEVMASARDSASLAGLYLGFGRIYASSDFARSRFYLERALRLAAPKSPQASDIHYQLACGFAAIHNFPRAIDELKAAFEHQSKALDETLASDIEEGGRLYELASTSPFDRAVNDLLLNMSIGIG